MVRVGSEVQFLPTAPFYEQKQIFAKGICTAFRKSIRYTFRSLVNNIYIKYRISSGVRISSMAYAHTKKDNVMSSQKTVTGTTRHDAAPAKPEKLSRQELESLYQSVTRRIQKTLAILAK